jgi:hypothetical protein
MMRISVAEFLRIGSEPGGYSDNQMIRMSLFLENITVMEDSGKIRVFQVSSSLILHANLIIVSVLVQRSSSATVYVCQIQGFAPIDECFGVWIG